MSTSGNLRVNERWFDWWLCCRWHFMYHHRSWGTVTSYFSSNFNIPGTIVVHANVSHNSSIIQFSIFRPMQKEVITMVKIIVTTIIIINNLKIFSFLCFALASMFSSLFPHCPVFQPIASKTSWPLQTSLWIFCAILWCPSWLGRETVVNDSAVSMRYGLKLFDTFSPKFLQNCCLSSITVRTPQRFGKRNV